jgi:dethiobiotin synthetase
MTRRAKGLFITATGTGIGKTFVSALILKALKDAGLDAGYYKAALSGVKQGEDGSVISDAFYAAWYAGLPDNPADLVSYVYAAEVSPHLAAKLEGNPPELDVILKDYARLSARHDYMVVEGSGGIICPIRYDAEHILMLEDIIKELNLGVLVVGSCALGTINATALTVEYLRNRNIPIKGIILNQYHGNTQSLMEDDNISMIKALCGAPVLSIVRHNGYELAMDTNTVQNLFA